MKKFLLALLLAVCALPSWGQAGAVYAAYNISCNAVTATGVCSYFTVPVFGGYSLPAAYSWSTQITGSPATVSTTLEGSIDGRSSLDGTPIASSTTFTSASLKFTLADVGKTIYIGGAKTGGLTFATTIAAFTNATTVTLSAAPNLSVVNAPTFVGTFVTLDTGTNTAGEIRSIVNYTVRYIRCNLGTLTGGSSPTVTCGIMVRGN